MHQLDVCTGFVYVKIYVIHNIFKCICKYFIYTSRIPNVAKMPMPFWRTCLWYFICCTPRCTNHVKNVCTGFTVDISSICKRVNKYQISNFPSYEWISKSALGSQRIYKLIQHQRSPLACVHFCGVGLGVVKMKREIKLLSLDVNVELLRTVL